MSTIHCAECGRQYSASLSDCPACVRHDKRLSTPDPASALNDLRLLIGQARGLLAEGDTDKADKMLIAALGVLEGEEG